MDPEKLKISTTTSGEAPDPGLENASAPKPIDPATGQYGAYWVLKEEERTKGWVRPFRNKYKHLTCNGNTSMGRALSETYAKDPTYYTSTFCAVCQGHYPLDQFVWDADGTPVGS